MIYDTLSRLARVRFTVGYLATLLAVSITLLILGPHARAQAIAYASTNLHNLAHGKVGTLLGSALVIDGCPMYIWLPGLLTLLAVAELLLHTARLTVVFLVGHVGATLVVALGLVAAVEMGWLPVTITRVTDVGMSYGALAVVGALTAAIPSRWRPAWIGWWLSVGLAAAVTGDDFTDAGHTVALVLGMLVATRFARPARWTPVCYPLFAVAVSFGFLLLAHTGLSSLTAVTLGAAGAVAADRVAAMRMRRKSPVAPAPPVAQPVVNG